MNNLLLILSDSDFLKAVPCQKIRYPANSVILQEDEDGQDLYLIIDGEAEIISGFLKDAQGQPLKLHRLGFNDIFGELSMFDRDPRSAQVNAVTDCDVYKINGPKLMAFLDEHPEKGYFVLRDILMQIITHLRQNNLRTIMVTQMYLNEHIND